jgi:hypothetical protein
VLFAEGFVAAEESAFLAACAQFIQRLVATPPFNLTRISPQSLSVYARFMASGASGPVTGARISGRTVFESAVDGAGVLTVSPARVKAVVDAEEIRVAGVAAPLPAFVTPGEQTLGMRGTLLVLLLPQQAGNGVEAELLPASLDEYHCVATSLNGAWHQLVLRAMGAAFGLGDEFELPGPAWLAPAPEEPWIPYFNLEYFDVPPLVNRTSPKWRELFGPAAQNSPPVIHPKPLPAATPDTTLAAFPAMPDSVELWEGGGGYRTKVYRTAQDCLMRRRIGDPALPVRSAPVPFCLACRRFLSDCIV